jgi:hypothetical protein
VASLTGADRCTQALQGLVQAVLAGHHPPPLEKERCCLAAEWRAQHAASYMQFVEQQLAAAQAQALALGLSPLKYVLTRMDRPQIVPGLWLEFGVAEGKSLGLIAKHLPAHLSSGVSVAHGVVFGFDSFLGLPEDWRPGFRAGHFLRDGARPPQFATERAAQLALICGWFQDTLPGFLAAHPEPVALLHLDSDVHSAALYVLITLIEHGRIGRGTIIVFDELFNYSGFENGELLALFEVVSYYALEFEWIGMKQKGCMQAALVVTDVLAQPRDAGTARVAAAALASVQTVRPDEALGSPQEAAPSGAEAPPQELPGYRAAVEPPRPRHLLPPVLREGNGRVRVRGGGVSGRDYGAEMARAIAVELLRIPLDDASSHESARLALEAYSITEEMKQMQQNGRHAFFKRVRGCEAFLGAYEAFVKEVIGPQILAELHKVNDDEAAGGGGGGGGGGEAMAAADTRTVLYQFPPAVRIYCSHIGVAKPGGAPSTAACSLTKLHCDAQYGHQDGEVNYWMPLTQIEESSTLWAETRPGLGDWYPFYPLEIGEAWRFPGTRCRHFTRPNVSGRTRVSIDFRVSVASCYDEGWKMPGNKERHKMRSIVY